MRRIAYLPKVKVVKALAKGLDCRFYKTMMLTASLAKKPAPVVEVGEDLN
jgi:hypothetical protein